jgi:regulator of protease activity HflC (stomatin/prohibitin superfamily)
MAFGQVTPGGFSSPVRQYADPVNEHVSLGRALRGIIWLVATALCILCIIASFPQVQMPTDNGVKEVPNGAAVFFMILSAIVVWTIVSGMRVAAQWERGVVLRLGSFRGIRGPGLLYIVPFIDNVRFVDMRITVLNVPSQKVITKDNVPAQIDGALYFLVKDPQKAVVDIQNFQFAVSQYAQSALRDVVGGMSLDELLSEREQIQEKIREIVEERVTAWGLHVDSIRLQDIEVPEDLKKMMSRQASAEREKRATITKAEGDKMAADNLAQAAATMIQSPGAMQLRSLQTIDGLGSSPSNTVVLFPVEWVELLKSMGAFTTGGGKDVQVKQGKLEEPPQA